MNLLCGCIALVMVFRNHLDWTAYLIFLAALFDVADGLAARILNASSPIGKELDSLADMISFGLVPGAILFKLLQINIGTVSGNESLVRALQFVPFIVTVFSALRLARFNIDTRQSDSFIGLPTPANTLLLISFPLILSGDEYGLKNILLNPYFIFGITALQSFLLVSELPLFALKFKNLSMKDNSYQFILIIVSAILVLMFRYAALPLIIFLYVLLSLIKNSIPKKAGRR
jgi:CDP-diacylglycerol--serine O-phosphatidyltransferase